VNKAGNISCNKETSSYGAQISMGIVYSLKKLKLLSWWA